jgi:hypothetical protein
MEKKSRLVASRGHRGKAAVYALFVPASRQSVSGEQCAALPLALRNEDRFLAITNAFLEDTLKNATFTDQALHA